MPESTIAIVGALGALSRPVDRRAGRPRPQLPVRELRRERPELVPTVSLGTIDVPRPAASRGRDLRAGQAMQEAVDRSVICCGGGLRGRSRGARRPLSSRGFALTRAGLRALGFGLDDRGTSSDCRRFSRSRARERIRDVRRQMGRTLSAPRPGPPRTDFAPAAGVMSTVSAAATAPSRVRRGPRARCLGSPLASLARPQSAPERPALSSLSSRLFFSPPRSCRAREAVTGRRYT